MPELHALSLKDFRNWTHLQFSPAPGINLLIGNNGSGKTSILEALLFICRGNSFRARSCSDCIHYGETSATINSSWRNRTGEFPATAVLGMAGERTLSLRGKKVHRRAELLTHMPLIFVAPHNLDLVGSSPAVRRDFLNATLLHIIPGYASLFSDYTTCLTERNSRLINKPKDYALMLPWDKTLAELGERLEEHRKKFAETLIKQGEEFSAAVSGPAVSISYARGWAEGMTLSEALQKSFARDLRYGFSTVGCHRADLVMSCDGLKATQKLSLGQIQMVSLALFFAVRHLLESSLKTGTLFLLDDIIQRLDKKNASAICDFMRRHEMQALLTASDHLSCWKQGETDATWLIGDKGLQPVH